MALLGMAEAEQGRRMIATHEVAIGMSFGMAAARVTHLIDRKALDGPSETAYEEGLTVLLRVGPFGNVRGLSKLVRVRVLEPVYRGSTLSVALRWEAVGAAGELFPVLDADLTVAEAGPDQVRLTLAGVYRPPLGRAGAALDQMVLHRVANATLRSLVEGVADALVHPAPYEGPAVGPVPTWWPIPEPGES
jgi:hypothetical protein